MKILLVQESTGRHFLSQCLEEHGHEVVPCGSVAEAWEHCRRQVFPFIVVDVAHPENDATALCRQIRGKPLGARSYILVGLSPDRAEHAPELFRAGADDVGLDLENLSKARVRLQACVRQVKERLGWQQTEGILNTRSQQQVAIAALGQCALAEDLATVMDLVSRFVMDMLEVEFCGLMELGGDAQTLKCLAGLGWREGYVGRLVRPAPDSLTGHTVREADIMVEDLEHDSRFAAPDPLLQEHGVVSGASVAVKGKRGVLGVLGAYSAQRRQFTEDDLHFLQGLANVVGAAMDRKQNEAEIEKHRQQVQHLQRLESIGQLTAGVAHDYNNVLTIIHGHVTLVLGDSQLPPGSAASLKTALEAVERAAGLTRQLLAFSRKQSLQPEPVELNTVIGNVTKLLDRLLGEKIRLEFKRCSAPTLIEADTGMIEQVIMNLAVNARDAMPEGGKVLIQTALVTISSAHLQQQPEARPGVFVSLSVTDTGCGMDEETLRRVFEPFFTTKQPGKGTGLGLATAYGIIKQHQGWIEVESQVARGTTFRVFLPSLAKAAQMPTAQIKASIPRGRNETILLVEDEASVRDLTRLLLEELGYQVLEAGAGNEALRTWSQHKEQIALLLADLVMPDALTGFDLAERLQEDRPNLKVLLTSGYDAERITKELPAKRGFHFLRKPYRTESLAQVVRECLDAPQ